MLCLSKTLQSLQNTEMKRAQVRKEVCASLGFSTQNAARGTKKPEGQFKSMKGGPVWTKKDVLQCVNVVFLPNSTFSPKIQGELSCYSEEGSSPRKRMLTRKLSYKSWDLDAEV